MQNSDATRLESLEDEVEDLHPLLARLLPKLPSVQKVEYTHARGEMGADFVMARLHDALGTTNHVGVIAKLGRIVQDYSEIERQIEECRVPRTFAGGKSKVKLDEVWVVATGTITKNAQEKIHEKYASTNLHFIDGHQLAQLIDRHIPDYWSKIDLGVGEYLSGLKMKNADADRRAALIEVDGLEPYVEQDIVRIREDEYRRKPVRRSKDTPVEFHSEIANNDFIIVEGSMGAGKSKLLRRLVEHYTDPETYLDRKLLPIHVTYKEFLEQHDANLEDTVNAAIHDAISNLERTQATKLLLIDGFDEVSLSAEQQAVAIEKLLDQVRASHKTKVVVATRDLTAFNTAPLTSRGIARYEIKPLTMGRVIEFLGVLCAKLNLHTRVIEDLKKSQLFKELPKSPIAAILLARLLNESSEDIPSNMTELYAKYMELMLGRWDIEKGLQSQKEYEALDTVMMDLAAYLIDNQLIVIGRNELEERFKQYLSERNLQIDPEALFEKALARSGIIVDDAALGTVTFKHRTFAEFLYAKRVVKRATLSMDHKAFSSYWLNVYFFWFGLRRDAPNEIASLSGLEPLNDLERWQKRVQIGNYALAAYATPYHVIATTLSNSMLEAAAHFDDLVNKRIKSPFLALPRMHILYFMQAFVRFSFGYSFFANAVEEAALQIHAAPVSDDLKAYALFFLSVSAIDGGKTDAFDFLLEEYGSRLPIDIALGVSHEGERMKLTSDVVKKQERRIRKAIKGDSTLANRLDRLYEVPLLPAGGVKDEEK